MTRFTDELRAKVGDQWERVVHHKFTKELADGTIDRDRILKRYLVQDHRFLDSFVILLASIVAHLPSLPDRIPGCQFLAVITGPENTYFERSFEKLGISEKERDSIPDAKVTQKFCNLMRSAAASRNLEEMLAVIVVCEWSYLSWGQTVLDQHASKGGICRKDFVTYEWVDLHSGPAFEAVISYLRELLDREGERLRSQASALSSSSSEQETAKQKLDACEKRFMEAVQLEEDFFDYAYQAD
mmetsp:Transcript_20802/g.48972  ORF Transcript_20802/g.48972 Transcript_20802/m.48972 type:complete len:242 (-) Transcript_20802:1538-2263(-)